jgi:hypothetical protein
MLGGSNFKNRAVNGSFSPLTLTLPGLPIHSVDHMASKMKPLALILAFMVASCMAVQPSSPSQASLGANGAAINPGNLPNAVPATSASLSASSGAPGISQRSGRAIRPPARHSGKCCGLQRPKVAAGSRKEAALGDFCVESASVAGGLMGGPGKHAPGGQPLRAR